MPDWVALEKMLASMRKKHASGKPVIVPLPARLPAEHIEVVNAVRNTVLADLPKLLDSTLPARKLLDQTPAFMGRYFWVEDALSEVDHFERETSAAWSKSTGGHSDDSSLLTLFLTIAAGAPHKTLLTGKTAATLVRKIRKTGLNAELAQQFIAHNAPEAHRSDTLQMWEDFLEEAQATLLSDRDTTLNDALALLRRECNVSG
jgi:hypothetical protein